MYQKLTIIGYLGNDPEMRYMPDGTAVTSFSVATSRKWNDPSGNRQEETTWFRVSAWNSQAESSNRYLKKGDRVLVEGRLQPDKGTGSPRIWTRQDGTAAASFEVRAFDVRFMSAKGESTGGYEGGQTEESSEIPF